MFKKMIEQLVGVIGFLLLVVVVKPSNNLSLFITIAGAAALTSGWLIVLDMISVEIAKKLMKLEEK